MEDTKIVELYLSRSETAISETAGKYGAYLNQIAYRILRSREDTEEIVEDTYFAAWNAIPPAIPKVLRHFLSRITRNLAYDRLDYITAKRRDPHMQVLLSELDDCVPASGSIEKTLEAKAIGDILNRFLGTLERTDCAVFLGRYYYNMTIAEISDKYRLTQRNVKYRLSCLRSLLREQLEKEGISV